MNQCEIAHFSWEATTAPYYLFVLSNDEPISNVIDQAVMVPETNKASWRVDLPAGTNVTLAVRDATGEIGYSYGKVVGVGSGECLDVL